MYLWNKDEAQCNGGTEDNEEGYDEVGVIWSVFDQEGDGHARDTHDDNVIRAHPDILGIVQCRDTDLAGLPGQETTKDLE